MFSNTNFKNNIGFTLIEILVSLATLSLILLAVNSFFFLTTNANKKTKDDGEALDNARRAMEIITYEIKGGVGIYSPTTTANQLSLETHRYLQNNESTTYIDFFICGQAICFKKESQSPISLTSDNVQVENLSFSQISNNGKPSIKIDLTVNSNNNSSVSLSSIVSLRNY